jgi:hypothetical protein
MSKVSRRLALCQWVFAVATALALIRWLYTLLKTQDSLFLPLIVGLVALGLLIHGLTKAANVELTATSYRVVQGGFVLLHLAALALTLSQSGLLPGADTLVRFAEYGFTPFSFFHLATDLLPLCHLIALLAGAVPLLLPMMPAVREKL